MGEPGGFGAAAAYYGVPQQSSALVRQSAYFGRRLLFYLSSFMELSLIISPLDFLGFHIAAA